MENIQESFATHDFYLSAYLKAKGLPLLGARRAGHRVIFTFPDKEKALLYVSEFFNGGLICVSLYTKAIQDLKTLINMEMDRGKYGADRR